MNKTDIISFSQLHCSNDPEETRSRATEIDGLQIALRTQPNSFVTSFVASDGLPALLDFLGSLDPDTGQTAVHAALLGCLKALMNNSVSYGLFCMFPSHGKDVQLLEDTSR